MTIVGVLRRGDEGLPGVPMRTVWRFRSTEGTCDSGATDAAGQASCTLTLSNMQVGFPVVVEVLFDYEGQTYRAETVFTPR
jgi:hypothetical protein